MSAISFSISLPLDSDQFLRRECPLCLRQFKIETQEADRQSLIERELEAYLLQEGLEVRAEGADTTETDEEESELWCPYCGQTSPPDQWWTQEQIAYIHVFAHNIVAQIINDELIRPMKRKFSGRRSGFLSLKFEGKEMEYQDPWISPEPDDMTIHALPCCNLQVKLDDDWSQPVYCYQCGFPHTTRAGGEK
jgi:hypothetical protein